MLISFEFLFVNSINVAPGRDCRCVGIRDLSFSVVVVLPLVETTGVTVNCVLGKDD